MHLMVVEKLWGQLFGGKTPLQAPSDGSGPRPEKRDGRRRSQQHLKGRQQEIRESKCFMAVNKESGFQSMLSIMGFLLALKLWVLPVHKKGPVASI